MPVAVTLAVVLVATGCRPSSGAPQDSAASLTPVAGTLAGRPYAAYLPADVPGRRVPLVVFLHGGGGNATSAQGTTCADGDPAGPTCLQVVGLREGFITVYASGTSRALTPGLRTWNAGGGSAAYSCVSGYACQSGADDVGYLRELVAELLARYPVDPARVYVMGFSNGAAMAHRVACEMADEVAAVVTVSGENQFATGASCSPARPISVIEVHGTADRCWTYETSTTACADQDSRPKVGVAASVAGWVARDGCAGDPTQATLPDTADDGTSTTESVWRCAAGTEVRLLTVSGGGHVFPGGSKVRDGVSDVVTRDWGAELLWQRVSGIRLP